MSRRWRVTGWLFAAVWLFYLNDAAVHRRCTSRSRGGGRRPGRPGRLRRRSTCCCSSGPRGLRQPHRPIPVGRARVGAGAAARCSAWPASRAPAGTALAALVYVAAAAVFLLPRWQAWSSWCSCALTRAGRPGWCRAGRTDEHGRLAVLLASFAMYGVSGWPSATASSRAAQAGDRPARGRRGAGPDRPRPARHPRPLADRGGGQGRAGRAAARASTRSGPPPRSPRWRRWPGTRWPTCGAPRRGVPGGQPAAASWPAPGRRWPRRASRPTLPARGAGAAGGREAVRLGGPGGGDQRGPAQRGAALRGPGRTRTGGDQSTTVAAPVHGRTPRRARAGRACGERAAAAGRAALTVGRRPTAPGSAPGHAPVEAR